MLLVPLLACLATLVVFALVAVAARATTDTRPARAGATARFCVVVVQW